MSYNRDIKERARGRREDTESSTLIPRSRIRHHTLIRNQPYLVTPGTRTSPVRPQNEPETGVPAQHPCCYIGELQYSKEKMPDYSVVPPGSAHRSRVTYVYDTRLYDATPIETSSKQSVDLFPLTLFQMLPPAGPKDENWFPHRLDPLHPPGVWRRTVALETVAAHQHNQQRAINMQQREYSRFHQGWRRPFYGTATEKEEYRREIRQMLKTQMSEKWSSAREVLASQSEELEALKEADRLAVLQDIEQGRAKALFMRRYRDENKRLMENKWRETRLSRSMETLKEREVLQYNPINWSGTLK